MLHLYHDIGTIIYFGGDDTMQQKSLKDIVILDPQWLIDIFKRVITVLPDERQVSCVNVPEVKLWYPKIISLARCIKNITQQVFFSELIVTVSLCLKMFKWLCTTVSHKLIKSQSLAARGTHHSFSI